MKNLRPSVCATMLASSVLLVGCGRGDPDAIIRVSRQNNSGTYVYFRETVLGDHREFKAGSYDQSGSKDVVELVARTPNAIGYSGMGYATDEVKMVPVSAETGGPAIPPTVAAASDGTYPLARDLYVYVVGEPTGSLKHFVDWIHSPRGQEIVEEIGYVPIEPVEMADTGPPPDGTIKIGGSDTMINLGQAWAEDYMRRYANVNLQVSGGGSGVGIKALIDGTVQLANASRDIKSEERKQIVAKRGDQPIEYTVGRDALAIYVHRDNPIEAISLMELAEIYGDGGSIVRWSQLRSSSE
jgi:ABC-type phosphate transport system substrate-binding protein